VTSTSDEDSVGVNASAVWCAGPATVQQRTDTRELAAGTASLVQPNKLAAKRLFKLHADKEGLSYYYFS
jgi:hypothetical protein